LVCLFAIAYVNAAPADEQTFSDNVDAFHPSDDSEIIKTLIAKKLIFLKIKALKKHLGK